MLKQQLFQVVERSFVCHSLSYLNYGMPRAGSKILLTVLALLIADCKLYKCRLNEMTQRIRSSESLIQIVPFDSFTTTVTNCFTCCSTAPFMTSFWIVSLMCKRREWGSVQIHTASNNSQRFRKVRWGFSYGWRNSPSESENKCPRCDLIKTVVESI